MVNYAIISLGGKQYRVHEGERLLVDRLPYAENKTFHPDVLLAGGGSKPELAPKGVQVTAKVVGHVRGEKVRIGKFRPKTGYRRRTGFRSSLSQIQIQKIATKQVQRKAAAQQAPKAEKKAPPKKTTKKAE
jgi:large subunit ribosomal protein L21